MTALRYLQEIGCAFQITNEEQAVAVLIESHRQLMQQNREKLEAQMQTSEGKAIVESIKNMTLEETISTVLKMSDSLIKGAMDNVKSSLKSSVKRWRCTKGPCGEYEEKYVQPWNTCPHCGGPVEPIEEPEVKK